MSLSFSWADLLSLNSAHEPANYLKILTSIRQIKVRSIAEIGVYRGKTSQSLRLFFPEAHLFLIDPWKLYDDYLLKDAVPISRKKEDFESAYEEVKSYFAQDSKTTIIRKASVEGALDVPNNLDLVFIDGNHSYHSVKQDIETWLPKIRKGGMISGHDYSEKEFPQVVKAVSDCFKEKDITVGFASTWCVSLNYKPDLGKGKRIKSSAAKLLGKTSLASCSNREESK